MTLPFISPQFSWQYTKFILFNFSPVYFTGKTTCLIFEGWKDQIYSLPCNIASAIWVLQSSSENSIRHLESTVIRGWYRIPFGIWRLPLATNKTKIVCSKTVIQSKNISGLSKLHDFFIIQNFSERKRLEESAGKFDL